MSEGKFLIIKISQSTVDSELQFVTSVKIIVINRLPHLLCQTNSVYNIHTKWC